MSKKYHATYLAKTLLRQKTNLNLIGVFGF